MIFKQNIYNNNKIYQYGVWFSIRNYLYIYIWIMQAPLNQTQKSKIASNSKQCIISKIIKTSVKITIKNSNKKKLKSFFI